MDSDSDINVNNSNSNSINSDDVFQDVTGEQLDLCYYILKECDIDVSAFQTDDREEDEENKNCDSGIHQKGNNNNNNNNTKGTFNESDILCSIQANQNTGTDLTKSSNDLLCAPLLSSTHLTTLNRSISSFTSNYSDCADDKHGSSISSGDLHRCSSSSSSSSNNSTITCRSSEGDVEITASDGPVGDKYNGCSNLVRAAMQAYQSRQLTPILKEELKFLIQSRRLSEGKEEMEVQFQPPSPSKLNAKEVERIERRKAQNRKAARRCRQKKKTSEEFLIQKIRELREFNTNLVQKCQVLRGEKQQLMEEILQHALICPSFANPPPSSSSSSSSSSLQHLLDDSNDIDSAP